MGKSFSALFREKNKPQKIIGKVIDFILQYLRYNRHVGTQSNSVTSYIDWGSRVYEQQAKFINSCTRKKLHKYLEITF